MKIISVAIILFVVGAGLFALVQTANREKLVPGAESSMTSAVSEVAHTLSAETEQTGGETAETASVVAAAPLPPIPDFKVITLPTHVWQTFNNCSMGAFSMLLSYYGVHKGQAELAELIRPWNNPQGDNDDKSTVFEELEPWAAEFGLTPYYRANGTVALLEQFIANDIPVMVRTLTKPTEDYLHFRVVVGYDRRSGEIIQDDSMQGKGLRYTHDAWNAIWKEFNYQYMTLAKTAEQRQVIEAILGEETDKQTAWKHARERAETALAANEDDIKARYNLLTAAYYLGDDAGVVREFERVEPQLSKYKLWYQIEPIEAYFKLGAQTRVLELADRVLESGNKAVSELYLLKGRVFEARGQTALARAEYEKAVMYNKRWKPAQDALNALVQ